MEDQFPVFVSYAHKDNEDSDPNKRYLDRLKEALEPLALENQVQAWSDQDCEMGGRWENEIRQAVMGANAAVLLVSPAFLASKYIRNSELPILLKNAADRGVLII